MKESDRKCMKKKIISFVLVSILVLGLTACGSNDGGKSGTNSKKTPIKGNAVTMVMNTVGNNLDPVVANSLDTSIIMNHVYDCMLAVDDEFNLKPAAISQWSVTEDGKTYRLSIREDLVFQNGEKAVIDDYLFSFDRLREMSEGASFWGLIKNFTAEGNELVFELKAPNTDFLRNMVSYPLMNKAYCEEKGDEYANAPMGTGPYKVAAYTPGDSVTLEAWGEYPFDKAAIKTIKFKAIPETASQLVAFETNDAQIIFTNQRDLERAKAVKGAEVIKKQTTQTRFISMNAQKAPFDNVKVRQAIAMAYNKEGYAKIIPGYRAIDSMTPEMFSTYCVSDKAIQYDPEKAKALLEEAGYNESNPLKFEASIYSGSDPILEAFQADLKNIGVEMSITSLEFGVFLEKMSSGKCQFLAGSWANQIGTQLGAFAYLWSESYGMENVGFYKSEEADALYNQALACTDDEELKQLAQQAADILAEQVPMFPTFTNDQLLAYNSAIEGMSLTSDGIVSFRNAKIVP